jgi:hypothetical protein
MSKSRQGNFSQEGVFGRKNRVLRPKTEICGPLDSASDLWEIWKIQTKPDCGNRSRVFELLQHKQFAIIYKKSVSRIIAIRSAERKSMTPLAR